MDYSKLSDKDLIALSKNDYASLSDEGLKYLSGSTTDSEPNKKGVDLTPSGLYKSGVVNLLAPVRAAIQGEDIETARRNGAQALENFKPAKGAGDFLVDMAVYSKLPMLKTAGTASKAAKIGSFAGNAAIQGGLPTAIESMKREGDPVSGAVAGTTIGGILQGLAAAAPKTVQMGAKAGQRGLQLVGKLGQVKPETLKQAIKPDSIALDLSGDEASNMLYNITKDIRKNFDKLKTARGEKVNEAIMNLGENAPRFDVKDLLNDVKGTFDKYQMDTVNPARLRAGGLETELNDIVNSATRNPAELYKVNPENKVSGEYLKDKENEAFSILSAATGKPVNWLKSQLKADTFKGGVGKRKEFIDSLARESDDKIADLGNGYFSGFQYYRPNDLSDISAGQKLVDQALDDILNRNFRMPVDDLTRAFDNADAKYNELVSNLANDARNESAYENAFKELKKITKDLPEGAIDDYLGKLSAAADDIYNKANTVSPLALQGIKRTVGDMAKWGDETTKKYVEPITEQIYGKFAERLSELSPEIKAANKAFSDLMQFKKNDTVSQILKGDLLSAGKLGGAPSTLKSYKSSINKESGARNLKDLEKLLVKEAGQAPFLNKIDDINAAMDLLKNENTGVGSLASLAKTVLTNPTLRAVRGINKMEIPQRVADINKTIEPLKTAVKALGLNNVPAYAAKAIANSMFGGM